MNRKEIRILINFSWKKEIIISFLFAYIVFFYFFSYRLTSMRLQFFFFFNNEYYNSTFFLFRGKNHFQMKIFNYHLQLNNDKLIFVCLCLSIAFVINISNK